MTELTPYIDDFLAYLDLEQNASPATLKSYRLNLEQFQTWRETGGPGVLSNLTVQDFVRYLREQRDNTANTIAQKLASMKSFFNYLSSVEVSVPKLNASYKKIKTNPFALTQKELDLLLQTAADKCLQVTEELQKATGKTTLLQKQLAACYRDILMMMFLAGTGLRISELCALDVNGLDIANGSVTVIGKGQKERLIYFDLPDLKDALNDYLQVRSYLTEEDKPLFVSLKDGRRISVRGAQYIFKVYVKAAGLSERVTPHTLRHTFATLSIEMGANIKAIAQILGHSDVGITLKMYTHLSSEYVRKVFQLCNPFTKRALSLEEAVAARRNSLIFINDNTNQWQRKAVLGFG